MNIVNNIKKYLSISSVNNLIDVNDILNTNISKQLFDIMELNKFFNNNKVRSTYNRFYTSYHTQNITILSKEEEEFDPKNINKYIKKYGIDPEVFKIDGIINGKISKEFNKLNKLVIYNVKHNNTVYQLFFYHTNNHALILALLKRFNTIIGYNKDEKRLKFIGDSFKIHFILYPVGRSTYKQVKNIDDLDKEMEMVKRNGCYNCSSGYTMFYVDYNTNNTTMMVSRVSEALGLFTHELGHLLGMDLEIPIENDSTKTISGVYGGRVLTDDQLEKLNKLNLPVDMEVNMTESLCNTNTTFIHSICNAIELADKVDTNNYKLFEELFKIEILYAIYHSAKILYWLNYNDFDSFFNGKSDIVYKQKAYLFEYTIVRSFMLMIYPKLFDIMSYDNDRGYMKFKLDKDDIYDKNKLTVTMKNKWDKYIDNTLDLMVIDKKNGLRLLYEKIFNLFIEKVRSTNTNKNTYVENSCGNINMEYFCIDRNYGEFLLDGGNCNFYEEKYMKYKKKYLQLKEGI